MVIFSNQKSKGRFAEPFVVFKEFLDPVYVAKSLRSKAPILELSPDFFVGNSQFMTTFFSSISDDISPTWSCHSGSESVSSHAFNSTWLECTFHEIPNLTIYDRGNISLLERILVRHEKSREKSENGARHRFWIDNIMSHILGASNRTLS